MPQPSGWGDGDLPPQEPQRGRRSANGWARPYILLLALALIWTATPSAAAQTPIDFDVTLEPSRATVGDRLTLTIVARHSAGTQLAAPDGPEDFAPLELVEVRPPETRDVGDGLQETRFTYVLAAFQTGELRPPPLTITARGESEGAATVQPPAVTIESVLTAGANPELRDLKGPLQASAGTPPWVWAALLMAAFAALTVLTMVLVRRAVLRPPPPPAGSRVEAPDEAARRELDEIAGAGLLDRGELKEHYGRIATCLRQYLSRRFDISAVAMTPPELALRLEELEVDRWPVRLALNLLQQCEAVQFAQYEPARERAEADLSTAYEVVKLTRRRDEASQPREEAAAPS